MNAKTCRRLRRLAGAQTVGQPYVAYDVRKYPQRPILKMVNGLPVLEPQPDHFTHTVKSNTTRGVYLALKRKER